MEKVAIYNKKGVFLRAYNGLAETARQLNLNKNTVSASIRKKGLLSKKYYLRKFTDIPEKRIKIEVTRRLGKEVRCFRVVRGHLKFVKRYKNLALAADFVKMHHRTFASRVKKGGVVEHRGKTYLFRYVYKEDQKNMRHHHHVRERRGKARANSPKYVQPTIPIKLIDKDGNEFYFKSTMDAVRKFNMNRVAILHVLAGRQQRTFGFKVERTTFEEVEKHTKKNKTTEDLNNESATTSTDETKDISSIQSSVAQEVNINGGKGD